MIYTVDRLEGAYALLEDEEGSMVRRLRSDLSPDVAEGDKLELTEEGFCLRPEQRRVAQAESRHRLEALLERKRREK